MEDSVKERLRRFLNEEKIPTSEFCQTIGVSPGYVTSIRESLQPDKLKSIAINYPQLNIGWLMTGFGNMINITETIEAKIENENIILPKEIFGLLKQQTETILSQQKTIEFLSKTERGNVVHRDANAKNAGASGF